MLFQSSELRMLLALTYRIENMLCHVFLGTCVRSVSELLITTSTTIHNPSTLTNNCLRHYILIVAPLPINTCHLSARI